MTKRPLRPVRDRDGVTMASMLRGLWCEDVFFGRTFDSPEMSSDA